MFLRREFLMIANIRQTKFALILAGVVGAAGLTGCMHTEYRCPLDPGKSPESATACAGMHDAIMAARKSEGGKTSVLIDDRGRRIPAGMIEGKPAVPVTATGSPEPYRDAQGNPIYEQPKVFRTWTSSFVDAEGNLHEGHHAWFTTPGRWSFGELKATGEVGADLMMKPARPTGTLPENHGSLRDAKDNKPLGVQAPPSKKDADKAALNNLSKAANAAGKQPAGAMGASTPADMAKAQARPEQQDARQITNPAINLAQ